MSISARVPGSVRSVLRGVLLLAVLIATSVASIRFGRFYEREVIFHPTANPEGRWASLCGRVGLRSDLALASLGRLFRFRKTYAQFEQDLWVTQVVAPGKRNGYYVDVGSADGERISNTRLLEDLSWRGICVDPIASNMRRRTCHVVRQPIYSTSGQKVRFRLSDDLSGISESLGFQNALTRKHEEVELVTATLDEVLAKANAPSYIDYISLDIEGAEYQALLGLSFDKYKVGAFTIEHNFEKEKRENIRRLLESKGYVRARAWAVEDWYVSGEIAANLPPYYSGLQ